MSALCPACGHEQSATRRFCTSCGEALPGSCPECGSPAGPGERFCGDCGTPLPAVPSSASARALAAAPGHCVTVSEPEGERKQLTVLFADVQGSMEIQEELDIEVWAAIVDRFVTILADGVRRFGGTIDKFTGDGIMALFGAPEAQEDHARRGCHAAWHMSRAIRVYAEELRGSEGVDLHVRLGLNSGEAVVGRGGESLRLDPLGHTVGLAQRMEALATPDSTYLTERTARLVEGWFRVRDLGPMTVKGAREPIGVFVLEGPTPPRSASRGTRPGSASRLVGRSAEMAILEDALARAAEGHAQVVGVVGEPGVGKSRLCEEFIGSVLVRGLSVRRTAGVSHGRDVPLLPILAYFRDYFGISDTISASQSRERIGDRLLGLDPGFVNDLPLFFDFLEVPDPERPAPPMAAEVRMRRIFEVLRRVTARRSERELAVLMLEDLHWFDPQSQGFLERLIENFPGSRTLVVTNFRPEFSAAWMRHSYYRQIPLLPLSPEAVGEMVGEMLGDDPSLAPVPAYLVERTGGNPFFVEEVVRALAEDGTLQGHPGRYRLTRPLEKAALPPSVQSVLAARIDRLSAEHKPVLQSAAVIGRIFAETVLARVMGRAVESLGDALSALCAAELLQEAQRSPVAEYRFWHALTQEVAYGSLLARRRERLHAAVADALIEHDADHLDEAAAVVAWHWERAGRRLEAASWSVRAGNWALRSDLGEALRRWSVALDLLAGVDATAASLEVGVRARIRLIQFGARRGVEPAKADQLEAEGRSLAERLGHVGLRGTMAAVSGAARLWAGDFPGAAERYREASQLAELSDDPELRAAAYWLTGVPLTYMGPLATALASIDRGLAACDGDVERGTVLLGYSAMAYALQFRGRLLLCMGRILEAGDDLDQAIAIAQARAEPETLAWALAGQPWLAWLAGEQRDTLAAATEAMRLGEDTGNMASVVLGLEGVALAHLTTGRPTEAVAACEKALVEARSHRTGLFAEASLLTHLARARLATADMDGAVTAADEAVAIARCQGARVVECLALVTRAHVLRASGRPDGGVIDDLRTALSLVSATGALTFEPFIREELSHAIGGGEREAAIQGYEAIGARGHARRLRADLSARTVAAG